MTDQTKLIHSVFETQLERLEEQTDSEAIELLSWDAKYITAAILTLASVFEENLDWLNKTQERAADEHD